MKAFTRRSFISKTTTGIAGAILVPTILQSCDYGKSPSDRLLIAHIGVGSRGQSEMKHYFAPLETSYSVATCDPFKQRRDASANYLNNTYKERGLNAPKCKSYLNFEEILERDDIDAVHITTPDHWHVPAAIKAARAGKHIMLAKPLGLSYPNYKILEKELAANDIRFHYGTQQRSMRHMQLGIEMIKEGLIGEVEKVEVWAPGYNPVESPNCNEVPVPDNFDFDLWTGPAPLNSYCPDRVTNNSSWFQYDYSIGFLGGWGAHPLDVMIWALKDKMNEKYSCEGVGQFWKPNGMYNNIRGWNVNYEYDSGIKLHFVDHETALQTNMLEYRESKEGNGTTFYGSKGWISLSRSSAQSNIPELNSKLNNFPKNKKGRILSEENTMGQLFVDVVTGKTAETNPLDEAILSDSVSHLADIAIRTKRKITWNPDKGEVVDDAEANKLFIREMRKPYLV